MTTGWVLVNVLLGFAVSAVVAGVSILTPLHLDRDLRADLLSRRRELEAAAPALVERVAAPFVEPEAQTGVALA